MALSGTIDVIWTAQRLADRSLQGIGVLGAGEVASGEDYQVFQDTLNELLKSWSMNGPNLWTRADATVTLVTGTATYTLTPRPRSVENVRFAIDGTEQIPLSEWDRNDYDRSIVKANTGSPLRYVVDRQRTSTTLTFWPIPTFTSGTWTAPYSYERVWQDVTAASQDIDIPQEWFETLRTNVMARLADEYRIETPAVDRIRQRADSLYTQAMVSDRRGDIRFMLGGRR